MDKVRVRVTRRSADSTSLARAIQLTAAAVLATWGVLLISPLPSFGNPAYAPMKAIGWSEQTWGLAFLAVALLISGGRALGVPRLTVAGMVGASGIFAFVAVMLAFGNFPGFGWAGQLGYFWLCIEVLRRMKW